MARRRFEYPGSGGIDDFLRGGLSDTFFDKFRFNSKLRHAHSTAGASLGIISAIATTVGG